MKKFILSFILIVIFAIYVVNERPAYQMPLGTGKKRTITIPSSQNNQSVSQKLYKDGSYVGQVIDAFYGNVQVKAVIQNGAISDVQFLDYPHDRNTSIMINSQAMPWLKEEAIQAQNANVDIISGATYTSEAFKQSLGDALSQAKI